MVMAVHNAGTTDHRVVKSAEAARAAGYDCHVVGTLTGGLPDHEVVNGVTYHRVALKIGLEGLIMGLWPRLYPLARAGSKARRALRRVRAGATASAQAGPAGRTGPAGLLARAVKNIPLGLACVRGAYCFCLYPKLAELAGHIYHAHELHSLAPCVLAARASGAKVVYDSHELEAHRNAPWSGHVRASWARHERRLIGHADSIVTVSQGCADALRDAYSLPEVTVVRNTPPRRQEPAPTGLRASLGVGEQVPLIVYVGSATFNRGLENVLLALRHLPGYVLATVGPCREGVRDDLMNLASRLDLGGRVFMHEKVPADQVVSFIASADLSIMPIQKACLSYYYCLPNKLFESAFAAVPVVASDFPDMRRFITDNDVGEVCDETDPLSIAQAIRKVHKSRAGYFTPAKIDRIRRQYCFERESRKLLAIYDRLTGGE